ncbi:hypothetical protein D3C87_879620 [compost metagenome]
MNVNIYTNGRSRIIQRINLSNDNITLLPNAIQQSAIILDQNGNTKRYVASLGSKATVIKDKIEVTGTVLENDGTNVKIRSNGSIVTLRNVDMIKIDNNKGETITLGEAAGPGIIAYDLLGLSWIPSITAILGSSLVLNYNAQIENLLAGGLNVEGVSLLAGNIDDNTSPMWNRTTSQMNLDSSTANLIMRYNVDSKYIHPGSAFIPLQSYTTDYTKIYQYTLDSFNNGQLRYGYTFTLPFPIPNMNMRTIQSDTMIELSNIRVMSGIRGQRRFIPLNSGLGLRVESLVEKTDTLEIVTLDVVNNSNDPQIFELKYTPSHGVRITGVNVNTSKIEDGAYIIQYDIPARSEENIIVQFTTERLS